jgi:hypothetical protein
VDWIAVANELMRTQFMKSTSWSVTTLAMWLRDGCQCVYCEKNMLDSYDIAYYSSATDHLLPVSIYPELGDVAWNRVLTCSTCNGLKLDWDANRHPEMCVTHLYVRGTGSVAASDREELFQRAKAYVLEKRRIREALFEKERRLIAEKLTPVSRATAGA